VPRLVEAFAGKKVVGASAGTYHTVLWTDEGELFTFGAGRLGHRGWWMHWQGRRSLVQPQLIISRQRGPREGSSSPLGTEKVGVSATEGKGRSICRGWWMHWQERRRLVQRQVRAGELLTFGGGGSGSLGHGGTHSERVPRLVDALAAKEGGRCIRPWVLHRSMAVPLGGGPVDG